MKRSIHWLIAASIMVLAAWAASRWASEPVPASAAGTTAGRKVVVTDLAGRQVEVRVPAQRVILGEGRQLYLVAALDTDDPLRRLVAWGNDLMQADPDTYAQYREKFPAIANLPVLGGASDGGLDIEQAIALRPDVVILGIEAQRAGADARYIEKLGAAGIPVVYVDFRYKPLENTERTMRLLGKLFGHEARAEEFIAFRARQMRRVAEVIEGRQPARPRVFIERIGGYAQDCCATFGNENFGRFVELAGGRNVAGPFIHGTFGQLNPEQVIASDPQHVVVTSANWEAYVPGGAWIGVGPGADLAEAARKLQSYPAKPAYAGTQARRDAAFHAIWHQFYNSPYQFVAIQQLGKWLHPDLFADLDPDAAFRELHERFLPIAYRPGYWVSLQARAANP